MHNARPIPVLLASARNDDRENVLSLLAGTPWELIVAPGAEAALHALHEMALPIVLCDWDLDDQPWQETLRRLIKVRRRACISLLTAAGNPEMCQEVIRRGGFDLLARPLEKDQLLSTLICAYSQCRMHWLSFTRVRMRPAAPVIS